jgi:hypothetical protein
MKRLASTLLALTCLLLPTTALAESSGKCDDLPFVENVFWTTKYGPAAADILTSAKNMVPCSGGPYALCYYAGDKPAPCVVDPVKGVANCQCERFSSDDGSVYYVDINSILNTCVYIETITLCGHSGEKCFGEVNMAPVCDYIQRNALIPGADVISTFSTACVGDFQFGCTDCSGLYAGCMTAPCYERERYDGTPYVECACPLYDGPYQFGRKGGSCDLGTGLVWSAAYNTGTCADPPSLPGHKDPSIPIGCPADSGDSR